MLARRVRAFNPVPGATIRLVLRADAQGIDIATGQGVLRLLELQKAGGKRQPVDVFVRGWQP
ncbi:methionyl-tRNA formyltransferase [Bordetella pertussis]|nr:methionyl-tRNA formyltransferase [Bordetella pertussis]